jgi:hypothetical protein
MDPRAFQLLEFPKVLEALAGFAVSGPGGRACRSLSPLDDLDELVRAAVLVEETGRLISRPGSRFRSFPTCAASGPPWTTLSMSWTWTTSRPWAMSWGRPREYGVPWKKPPIPLNRCAS